MATRKPVGPKTCGLVSLHFDMRSASVPSGQCAKAQEACAEKEQGAGFWSGYGEFAVENVIGAGYGESVDKRVAVEKREVDRVF